MPVEFLGIAATNDGSEITARSGASFDKDYTLRLAPFDHDGPHYKFADGGALSWRRPLKNPENTGSQRLLALAAGGERFDRALWTRTAAVAGGADNSNALVGTPDTVAQAILDYIDLGVDIISMRGYDLLADAIDIGRHVIPIVREEVAKRDQAAAAVGTGE